MAQEKPGPNIAEEVGDRVFFGEMLRYFGVTHAIKFFGYCVLLGAAWREGEPKTVAVKRLCKLGLARRTAYQFLADLEEFKKHLQSIHAARSATEQDILQGVSEEVARNHAQVL